MGAITRGIANNILGNGAVDGTDALSGTVPATNIANNSLSNLTTFSPSVSGNISQVAGDPPAPAEGDVWYNTSTYKLKVRGSSAAAGSWATGGSLNTARRLAGARASGIQTASLAFGGEVPSVTGATESYNGSTWTEVNDLNTARYFGAGAGTQTAALMIGGEPPSSALTESWNGTSWTEVGDLNTARGRFAANGTQTSALAYGGWSPNLAVTESWNGTSWTEVNDLATARRALSGAGADNTSALAITGFGITTDTEQWNGAAWTEVNNVNTERNEAAGSGTVSTAILSGGNVSPGNIS
jgi:hypothetical protein